MNTLLRFPGGRDRALTLSYDDGVNSDIPLMEILDAIFESARTGHEVQLG